MNVLETHKFRKLGFEDPGLGLVHFSQTTLVVEPVYAELVERTG
jgi:hypothetical protein